MRFRYLPARHGQLNSRMSRLMVSVSASWRAAQALGQIGEASAKFAPEVAALLTDPDFDVGMSAATALKQMGIHLC